MSEGTIPREEWEWDGYPKHYILADRCQFTMSTKVGEWVISTVGHLDNGERAEKRPDLYNEKKNPDGIKMEEVGAGRFFETMVFGSKKASCECCEWVCDVGEDRYDYPSGAYQTANEAREGHMEICRYIAENQET